MAKFVILALMFIQFIYNICVHMNFTHAVMFCISLPSCCSGRWWCGLDNDRWCDDVIISSWTCSCAVVFIIIRARTSTRKDYFICHTILWCCLFLNRNWMYNLLTLINFWQQLNMFIERAQVKKSRIISKSL